MVNPPPSPRITSLKWGSITVEGCNRPFKDAKVFPGGAREWDWGEHGTGHGQGIQVGEVMELLRAGANAVVLSRGQAGRLRIHRDTLAMLERRGIPVHVHRTQKAVEIYNDLTETSAPAGLFHSTC